MVGLTWPGTRYPQFQSTDPNRKWPDSKPEWLVCVRSPSSPCPHNLTPGDRRLVEQFKAKEDATDIWDKLQREADEQPGPQAEVFNKVRRGSPSQPTVRSMQWAECIPFPGRSTQSSSPSSRTTTSTSIHSPRCPFRSSSSTGQSETPPCARFLCVCVCVCGSCGTGITPSLTPPQSAVRW